MLTIIPMSCATGVTECRDTEAIPDFTSPWAGVISLAIVVVVILIVVVAAVRRRRARR